MNAKNMNLFNRFQMNKNDYWDADENYAVELFQDVINGKLYPKTVKSEEEIREMYVGNFSDEEFGEYAIMITGADVPKADVISYGVDYAIHKGMVEENGYYFQLEEPETKSMIGDVSVYVTTKKKWNHEYLYGQWISFNKYINLEAFYKACRELFPDEENPELIFHSWDIPEERRKLWKFIKRQDELHPDFFLLKKVYKDELHILAYLVDIGEISEEAIEWARDNYIGKFDSYEELGKELVDMGYFELEDKYKKYFNYAEYGEDMSYDLYDVDGYYFWN